MGPDFTEKVVPLYRTEKMEKTKVNIEFDRRLGLPLDVDSKQGTARIWEFSTPMQILIGTACQMVVMDSEGIGRWVQVVLVTPIGSTVGVKEEFVADIEESWGYQHCGILLNKGSFVDPEAV